jgi:hypothetical protein
MSAPFASEMSISPSDAASPLRKTGAAEAVVKVQAGRLRGQALEGGSFLSPELSFDARTILFAWTQAKAKETYQWAPEYSFHIFKVNADGSAVIVMKRDQTYVVQFKPTPQPNPVTSH